jgi:formate hydrogenlyase subunit 6/NADH:ubiquinone oxidoreductase subunit I
MTREEELQLLKTKAKAIQERLHLLDTRIGALFKKASVSSQWMAIVDTESCVGCGICEESCPVGAIVVEGIAQVNAQRCTGCGRCVQACPKGALSLGPSGVFDSYQRRSWS